MQDVNVRIVKKKQDFTLTLLLYL